MRTAFQERESTASSRVAGSCGKRSYNAVMIRNVVLVKLRPGQDATAVAEIQEGLRNLDCPGPLSYTVGDDLGLREGNWSFAIVADFADQDSYQAYDQGRRAQPDPRPDRPDGRAGRPGAVLGALICRAKVLRSRIARPGGALSRH
jgi:hypothetical protein